MLSVPEDFSAETQMSNKRNEKKVHYFQRCVLLKDIARFLYYTQAKCERYKNTSFIASCTWTTVLGQKGLS